MQLRAANSTVMCRLFDVIASAWVKKRFACTITQDLGQGDIHHKQRHAFPRDYSRSVLIKLNSENSIGSTSSPGQRAAGSGLPSVSSELLSLFQPRESRPLFTPLPRREWHSP